MEIRGGVEGGGGEIRLFRVATVIIAAKGGAECAIAVPSESGPDGLKGEKGKDVPPFRAEADAEVEEVAAESVFRQQALTLHTIGAHLGFGGEAELECMGIGRDMKLQIVWVSVHLEEDLEDIAESPQGLIPVGGCAVDIPILLAGDDEELILGPAEINRGRVVAICHPQRVEGKLEHVFQEGFLQGVFQRRDGGQFGTQKRLRRHIEGKQLRICGRKGNIRNVPQRAGLLFER
jgi:hypothetical protein